MTSHTYIFNKTPEQLRLLGARGGRAFGRNQRARRALTPEPREVPPLPAAARPETTAEAIIVLDSLFPWLCRAEKRHSHRNQITLGNTMSIESFKSEHGVCTFKTS